MKYFGTILVVVALVLTGGVYFAARQTSCTEHKCFEGMRPAMVSGLAGYKCGCVSNY